MKVYRLYTNEICTIPIGNVEACPLHNICTMCVILYSTVYIESVHFELCVVTWFTTVSTVLGQLLRSILLYSFAVYTLDRLVTTVSYLLFILYMD